MGLREWRKPPVEVKARDTAAFDPMTFDQPLSTMSSALSGWMQLSQSSPQAYGFIYRSQPSIYTCIEFLATQIAGVGLKVYRRISETDHERLRDHPVAKLIDNPAPGLTYSRWMHGWVADKCVYGNHYQLKLERGQNRALIPLPPQFVVPEGGNIVAAERYRYTQNTTHVLYRADEIVHSRRYNPDDARIGVSPLEPLRRVLRSDSAALSHWEKLWMNGARIEGWLSHPGTMSDDAFDRLKASIKQEHSGSEGAGKVLITEEGMKFVPSEWSPREAEFIEGRKLTLETAARALNIPLAVLSLTESATYASQDAFHTQLYVDTLGPWFKEIEEEFTSEIIPWITNDPDIYVAFDFEEKLRGSFAQQIEAFRSATGVPDMSVNEARALKGLPRIDDPDYDLPVKPSNVIYGGAIPKAGEAPMPGQRQLRAVGKETP